MDYYKAFFATLIESDRFHQAMTGTEPVAGHLVVYMKGIKAVAAVIAAGLVGGRVLCFAVLTGEGGVDIDHLVG